MDFETLLKQNQEELRAKKINSEKSEVLKELKETKQRLDEIEKSTEKRLKIQKEHWFQTGEVTITSATSKGNYPQFENVITSLGYPSTSGTIENTDDTGNIFVAFSKNSADLSVNEIKIEPGDEFDWGEEGRITEIRYIHLRTDVDNTTYQIIAS